MKLRAGPLLTLGLMLLGTPVTTTAEAQEEVRRIGILWGGAQSAGVFQEFREALRELGWRDGENVVVEHRIAEGRYERLAPMARELVDLRVRVILTVQSPSTIAAKQATSTIPIVMVGNGDPVRYGLVTNLARPEANVTGLSFLVNEVGVKLLELLKEAVPRAERVAVFVNPTNPGAAPFLEALQGVAPQLRVTIRPVEVTRPDDFDRVFAALARERVDAMHLAPEGLIGSQRRRILDFAATQRLPVAGVGSAFVESGALLSYSPHVPTIWRRAAWYVDKLLKGRKPGDLPVEQPAKFEFVVNLKTAKDLGLAIPQSVLIRADRVIQ
ncbi:MAG: ABC transporter substrate-binding protein [Candidatus Rokubacteria bacterium]|nr:ABC transporter substrate-binding protein [Candidatus Rokubacteria bacterium]